VSHVDPLGFCLSLIVNLTNKSTVMFSSSIKKTFLVLVPALGLAAAPAAGPGLV
jgi:hypothetical protein